MTRGTRIHIGTSGWNYKHWKEVFYPAGLSAAGFLKHFTGEFDTVEINTSFYRLPKPHTLESWMDSVPKGFRFCPKMNRYLTQMKKLNDPEEPLHRFFTLFAPMKKKMGPTLIQLPPNLGFRPDKAEYFFAMLRDLYGSYKVALEVRHKSWLERPVIRLLARYNVAFVIADSGNRFPAAEHITAKDIYVRFHGPDGSYATSYPDEFLKAFADKCLRWSEKGHRLWIFFNNDVHGFAIANARTLKNLLDLHS